MLDTEKQDALRSFLQQQTKAERVEVTELVQLSGGAVQENYGLVAHMTGGAMPGTHRLVARMDAPGALSASLSRSQEFAVLSQAHTAGMCVPKPYWLCADKSTLGSEFYIMQWAAGSASARSLVADTGLNQEQRRTLLKDLGRNLAHLHELTYRPEALPFLRQPDPRAHPAQQRLAEYREILTKLGEHHPAIEMGLSCLERYLPKACSWVLCHGDFRTGNYLVHEGQLSAILDWEFAGWSDPYEDLGWISARCWRFGHPDREVGGVGDKADLYAGYEEISGRAVDGQRVVYWELMASVKWAVLALEQSHRFLSGQQSSLELALTGRMLPEIQQDLISHVRDLCTVHHLVVPKRKPQIYPEDDDSQNSLDDNGDRPNGRQLLGVAQRALLESLLPALPKEQHYNARMIVRVLDIARRESYSGSAIARAQTHVLHQFYDVCNIESPNASQADLASRIRAGQIHAEQWPALIQLLDEQLNLKLMLSNPKRVAAPK